MTQQFPPPQWQPPQWQPPAPPPPQTPRPSFWRSRKGAAVLLGGGLLAAVVVAGNSGSNSSSTTSSGAPRVTYSAVPGGLTQETWSSPGGGAPYTVESAAPSGSFGPGTYEVGTGGDQILPGKYKSTGPASLSGICYSARLKHNDGAVDDIIDNDASQGPSILNVKASDGYVEISGCTFTKAG